MKSQTPWQVTQTGELITYVALIPAVDLLGEESHLIEYRVQTKDHQTIDGLVCRVVDVDNKDIEHAFYFNGAEIHYHQNNTPSATWPKHQELTTLPIYLLFPQKTLENINGSDFGMLVLQVPTLEQNLRQRLEQLHQKYTFENQ